MKKYLFSLLFILFLVFISNTSFASTYDVIVPYGEDGKISIDLDIDEETYPYICIIPALLDLGGGHYNGEVHFFVSSTPIIVTQTRFWENNKISLEGTHLYDRSLTSQLSDYYYYKISSNNVQTFFKNGSYFSFDNFTLHSKNQIETISYYYKYSQLGYTQPVSDFSHTYFGTFDLKNSDGNTIFYPQTVYPKVKMPYFDNKSEILSGSFENMFIKLGDYNYEKNLYLHCLEVSNIVSIDDNTQIYYYNEKVINLNTSSIYYRNNSENLFEDDTGSSMSVITEQYYSVPKHCFEFKADKQYYFYLSDFSNKIDGTYGLIDYTKISGFDGFSFTTNSDISIDQTNQDINKNQNDKIDEQTGAINNQTNAIKDQTQAIEEQHETNKGIWGTIKEILSYINPFSENFFVYKLVELLVDGLKALFSFLFIPSNEYFSNWFSDLNDTFKDQFGILYYPVSVVIEFLSSLDESLVDKEPIISTPVFTLSFMNFSATLLPASSYNFNSLLTNDTFVKVHNFYLFFVNVIFTIGLIAFAGKVGTEIFRWY